MKLKRYIIFAIGLSLYSPVYADGTLTWDDCVREAAKHNPDLLSALQAMESSHAAYKGSFNGILPRVSLSNNYSDSSTSGINSISGSSESKLWTAEGTASLDLIDFGQWATIQAASASFKQSKANYAVAGTNALLNLYKAFASLLYAQEEITVDTTIRDTWKINSDMVNLRYKSGSESKGNNMNTQASLLQAQLNLEQASRDIEVAQQQLSQSLGMDTFNALVVTGTWTASPAPSPHPDFATMLAHEPQIQAQEAFIEQAEAAVKSAHSSLWPTLTLNYNKGTEGTSEFPSSPFWAFTGTVNYPLFGNGLTATYFASQSAQYAYEKARQDLRSLRNQTLTNLASAWSAYVQAQDQVRIDRAFLQSDQQRVAENNVLYQSGLLTFQDWILVMNEYVNFQTGYLKAEQSQIQAEAQWRFASGEQLGD